LLTKGLDPKRGLLNPTSRYFDDTFTITMKNKGHWISSLVHITNLVIPLNNFQRTSAMETPTEAKYEVNLEMCGFSTKFLKNTGKHEC